MHTPSAVEKYPVKAKQPATEEILSDEINEIITHHPGWLIRNGVSMAGVLVVLLFLLSWFVPYPESLITPMRMVARNVPKEVVAKTTGKLKALLVVNGQMVSENQPLAYIQTTGNHDDVLAVSNWVEQLEEELTSLENPESLSVSPIKKVSLGELQPAYYDFQVICREMLQTFQDGYYRQKLQALDKDIALINQQNEITLNLRKLALEDFKLQEEEHKVRSRLAHEQVIAPLELGRDKSKVLNKSTTLQQIEAHLLEHQIALQGKQKEVMETRKQIADIQNQFLSSLLVFKSKIQEWTSLYIVSAPQEGNVLFTSHLQENQYIDQSRPLFFVQPANSEFYGEIVANQMGAGKVAVGQSVIIRLESYPSTEYGYLQGRIEYISSLLTNDDGMIVHVSLPERTRTNYDKIVPLQNNMKATAEIVLQERRLPESLFYGIMGQ